MLKRRKTALANKRSYSDAKKAKIERCLCLVYKSSEDKEKDGTLRPLAWCIKILDTIIEELDVKTKNAVSKESLSQTQRKKVGELSRCPKPAEIDDQDQWAARKHV